MAYDLGEEWEHGVRQDPRRDRGGEVGDGQADDDQGDDDDRVRVHEQGEFSLRARCHTGLEEGGGDPAEPGVAIRAVPRAG
jgi:hypothetical protein